MVCFWPKPADRRILREGRGSWIFRQNDGGLSRKAGQYNGKSLEFRSVHVWEINNGKLVEFHVYYDDAYHNFWS